MSGGLMHIVIAGAGIIGRELAVKLLANGHDVVVIDIDKDVCDLLYKQTGALTVIGNATNLKILRDAGVSKADVLICLMRQDSDNISCSILAKSLGIKRIIARMRDPGYEQAYELAGVSGIVRVADLLLDYLTMEVLQPTVKKIMSLGGGDAYVYAIRIPDNADCIGRRVSEIASLNDFPEESLLMGIYKDDNDHFAIPRGNYILAGNDTVFVIARTGDISAIARALGVNT